MTVRALTPDGDIVTSGQHFIEEREEIAQTIATRLRLFRGEYFRDILDGTDWFGKVLTRSGGLETKDSVVQSRIRQTDGVLQIMEYTADYTLANRTYTISGSVLTEFGQIPLRLQGVTIDG